MPTDSSRRPFATAAGRVAALRAATPPAVLIALILVIGSIEHSFLSRVSLENLAADSAALLLLALGQTMVILTGRIDLSVAALASFTTVLLARGVNDYGSWTIPLVLLGVTLIGVAQGALHLHVQLPSFVVTLGGMFLWSGLTLVACSAQAITLSDNPLAWLSGDNRVVGLPVSALVAFGVALMLAAALRYLPIGRRIYAVGIAERAAMLAGVSQRRTVLAAFGCSALCSGLAAAVLVADFDAGRPGLADALLLPVIAAVVVGGNAITGGVGSVGRTLVGTAIIAAVRVGINVIGEPPQYQQVLYGSLVIIAVALTIDRSKLAVVK